MGIYYDIRYLLHVPHTMLCKALNFFIWKSLVFASKLLVNNLNSVTTGTLKCNFSD